MNYKKQAKSTTAENAFRKIIIKNILDITWITIQFYGKKNPDFDKGETYSLPFEVDLCYREGDFTMKSINIEPDGTVFLRNQHSDIDLEELSTNELEKLRSKLGDHILKNYIGIEYTCVKDIDDINDSMECDTGTELARLRDGNYIAVLKVVGRVEVLYKDDIYTVPGKFPKELKEAFHNGTASEDQNIEIRNNNWFEIWIYKLQEGKEILTNYSSYVESVGAETREDLLLSIKEYQESIKSI